MCYRYSVPGPTLLTKRFDAQFKEESFERKYHVASFTTPKLPVITNENPKQITLLQWGLIPFWVKDQTQAKEIQKQTANARAESIFDKPSFRRPAEKKHCLVLADGFYEWREFKGRNYPYYIQLKNHEPFAMAGLWDLWKNKATGEETRSFTIITTRANSLMEVIHNKKKRMPVILRKKDEKVWIDNTIDKALSESLLQPYETKEMEAYTISRLITAKAEDPDVPEILEPYNYPELNNPGQKPLF